MSRWRMKNTGSSHEEILVTAQGVGVKCPDCGTLLYPTDESGVDVCPGCGADVQIVVRCRIREGRGSGLA